MSNELRVDDVLISERLVLRPARAARLDEENNALRRLMQQFFDDSDELLNEVVKIACGLCGRESAGVTLEETLSDGTVILRWIAVTGKVHGLEGHTMPRVQSICGVTLDSKVPQLFYRPRRVFTYIDEGWDIEEALLVPWRVSDKTTGALWVMTHTEGKKFDREDLRLLQSLAAFAGAAILKTQMEEIRCTQERISSAAKVANYLAHQINNPLQALTNSLHLVEANGTSEHLENAILKLQRISSLVQEILQLDARPSMFNGNGKKATEAVSFPPPRLRYR